MPKKYSPSVGALVFAKDGAVTRHVEHLPETQTELNLEVFRRFAVWLDRRFGRHLTDVASVDDRWPDCQAIEDSRLVHVEVREVVHQPHVKLGARQREYQREIEVALRRADIPLGGLDIVVRDGYQSPPWPPIRTKRGQYLSAWLAQAMVAFSAKLPDLRVHQHRIEDLSPPLPVVAKVAAFRYSPARVGAPGRVRFIESFPFDPSEVGVPLTTAVREKIDKRYDKPRSGPLWLLLYSPVSTDWLFDERAESEARDLLRTPHPFDEVWSFLCMPEVEGVGRRLFPSAAG